MSRDTSHIAADSRLSGNISGSGGLTVDGRVDGDVRLGGDLEVTGSGLLKGDVESASLALQGQLEGRVKTQKATLGEQARLSGSIASPSVSIHPKARVDARFDMPLSLPRQVGSGRR